MLTSKSQENLHITLSSQQKQFSLSKNVSDENNIVGSKQPTYVLCMFTYKAQFCISHN